AAPDEERLLELALEAGADDLRDAESTWEITTEPAAFAAVRDRIAEAGIPMLSAELTMVPQTTVPVEGGQARQVLALVEALEDLDDVQNVYANFDIPESVMAELGSSQRPRRRVARRRHEPYSPGERSDEGGANGTVHPRGGVEAPHRHLPARVGAGDGRRGRGFVDLAEGPDGHRAIGRARADLGRRGGPTGRRGSLRGPRSGAAVCRHPHASRAERVRARDAPGSA